MSTRSQQLSSSGSWGNLPRPTASQGPVPDESAKPRETVPPEATVTVGREFLKTLQLAQKTVQAYVDAYVYSWNLLVICEKVRKGLAKAKKAVLEEGEPDWVDYWAGLSVELDGAARWTKLLTETQVYPEEVGQFAAALARATTSVAERSEQTGAFDSNELDPLDWQFQMMKGLIEGINNDCRDEAPKQVRKLAKVLDEIVNKMEQAKGIKHEEHQGPGPASAVKPESGSDSNPEPARTGGAADAILGNERARPAGALLRGSAGGSSNG